MPKTDLKKDLKHLYQPSTKAVVEVDVPQMNYLMVDGEGDPNTSQSYTEAVEVLFMVAYAVKFMVKKGTLAIDYGVMPLEGLWWVNDMTQFSIHDKSNWKWTAMVMQPAFVTVQTIEQALCEVKRQKNPLGIDKVRFAPFTEGRCAQIMHIGPFSEKGPTIERIHQYVQSKGEPTGKHHEIYLSDIRKADLAKWKTIIRQPMR